MNNEYGVSYYSKENETYVIIVFDDRVTAELCHYQLKNLNYQYANGKMSLEDYVAIYDFLTYDCSRIINEVQKFELDEYMEIVCGDNVLIIINEKPLELLI